jgi:hypothetical protein
MPDRFAVRRSIGPPRRAAHRRPAVRLNTSLSRSRRESHTGTSRFRRPR